MKSSEACKSNPDNIAVFSRLFECLHMEYSYNLTLAAMEGEVSAECPRANLRQLWKRRATSRW